MKNQWKQCISVFAAVLFLSGWAGKAESKASSDLCVVACIGDSITEGVGATLSDKNYPSQLQSKLGKYYSVLNFGVSGTTLLSQGDSPYINRSQYYNSQACDPDIVIIMLGTNDSKPQNWIKKDQFAADMVNMIHVYQNLGSKPTVYVATSPSVYSKLANITDAVVSNEVVPIQKAVAAQTGCQIIDINALTKEHSDWFDDGVHPNNNGYACIANAFADVVSKQCDPQIVARLVTRLNALPDNPGVAYVDEVKALQAGFFGLSSRQSTLVSDKQWDKLANAIQSVKGGAPTTKTDVSAPTATRAPVNSAESPNAGDGSTLSSLSPSSNAAVGSNAVSSPASVNSSCDTSTSDTSSSALNSSADIQTGVTADKTVSSDGSNTSSDPTAANSSPAKPLTIVLWVIGGLVVVAAATGGVFILLRRKQQTDE